MLYDWVKSPNSEKTFGWEILKSKAGVQTRKQKQIRRLKTKEMKSKGKLDQALRQFQFLPFYLQGF